MSAKNLFEDEDYAKQFEETAKRFGKGEKFDERKYYHFKLSCARKDNVTPRRANVFAEEVAEALTVVGESRRRRDVGCIS